MIPTWLWVSQDSLDQLKPLLLPSSVCWYLFYLSYIYLNKQKDYNLFFFYYLSMHPSIHPSFLSILSIYLYIYSSIFSSIEDIYQSDLFILSILPTYPDRYIHLSVSVYILLSIYYLYSSNLSIYQYLSILSIYQLIYLFISLGNKDLPILLFSVLS